MEKIFIVDATKSTCLDDVNYCLRCGYHVKSVTSGSQLVSTGSGNVYFVIVLEKS